MENKLMICAALIFLILALGVNIVYAEGEVIQQQAQTMPTGMPYQDAQAIAAAQQTHIDAMNAAEQDTAVTTQTTTATNADATTAAAQSTHY